MKKIASILLAVLLLMSAAACSKSPQPDETVPAETVRETAAAAPETAEAPQAAETAETEEPAGEGPEDEFRTIGDVLDFESPASGCYEDMFVYLFEKGGIYYRVEADITAEISEAIFDLDYFDPDKDQKMRDLVGDLPIRQLYVLSDALLPQEALDSLAGMTGQELLDMGFVPSGSYGFGEDVSMAYLEKGPFEYQVDFEEFVTAEEDPNVAEVIRPLTVKSAVFGGNLSSYATERDFDINGSRSLEEYESWFAPEPEPVFYSIPEIPLTESPFKTLSDVFAARGEHYSSSLAPDIYAIAFDVNGVYYRVEAQIAPEIAEQADAIDFFDEERDQKLNALLGPVPVTRVGDLSACIPSQEELDALVGLTGQDLLDMGFAYGSGYSFYDQTEIYLERGLCEYLVLFSEKVPEMEDYDAALDELMPPLTVSGIEFFQLSGACSDPELLW